MTRGFFFAQGGLVRLTTNDVIYDVRKLLESHVVPDTLLNMVRQAVTDRAQLLKERDELRIQLQRFVCLKCGGLRATLDYCGCELPKNVVSVESVAGGPDNLTFDGREVASRT
jgi:hypothetical protein